MLDEARVIFSDWQTDKDVSMNLKSILQSNPVGAKSEGWLAEIYTTFHARLVNLSTQDILTLAELARTEVNRDVWAAALHIYWAKTDGLYFTFVTEFLYGARAGGASSITVDEVLPFVEGLYSPSQGRRSLSDYGLRRTSSGLVRMAAEFGLLSPARAREIMPYVVPEKALLFLVHVISELEPNAHRMVNSAWWRLYFISPEDIEQELFRLHQLGKLHYDVAGSIGQLDLVHGSSMEYVRGLGR